MATGEPYIAAEVAANLVRNNQSETIYVDLTYQPQYEADGRISGILMVATDVTQQVRSRQQIAASEARFRHLVEEASVATCLLTGRELIIEVANQSIIDIWGKDKQVIGMPLAGAIPELEGQPFLQILDDIFTTGETYSATNALARHKLNGQWRDIYVDFTYKPLHDTSGQVASILVTAVDVTEKVIASRKLEESEARFRTIIEQAPIAIAWLGGKEMIVETANEAVLASWGKDDTILGKPLREAIPELEGQPFLDLLNQVYTTGDPYFAYAAPARLLVNGKMSDVYYDFIYTPTRNADNLITGVMVLATVVTDQVLARQKIEQAEASLRGLSNWPIWAPGRLTWPPVFWITLSD
ncbi:PAS domain-containing protein [Spirosoma sp. HMF3257]|uniref:PAC domain-containing protein n=1 Tax=Spirosoma telluris TaxID=2183553 RepID=A0A327NI51_9BACT|nr:PAS domain-containing protein [Spirosoma telluris]RAI74513.1 hypothetical protein HMF3257_09970 [Spirosoma telluris]